MRGGVHHLRNEVAFGDAISQLEPGGAIRRVNAELDDASAADRLAEAIESLLDDPEAARRMADTAREVVKRNLGSTQRTLEKLMGIMSDVRGPVVAEG